MGKPNNTKKQNNNNNNYFSRNIQQNGVGFIQLKNAQDIQREALKIFRDIARGNIDFEKYGNYFLDPIFLDNLLIACQSKLTVETILRDGVTMLYNSQIQMQQPCDITSMVLQDQLQKVEAYTCILQCLTSLKMSKDTAWLYTLSAQLSGYKYII